MELARMKAQAAGLGLLLDQTLTSDGPRMAVFTKMNGGAARWLIRTFETNAEAKAFLDGVAWARA